MADLYDELQKKSGKNCLTLSYNNPARMDVNEIGITITYPSGNRVNLPASMIKEAIRRLEEKGDLDVEEIHKEITVGHKTRTDKLMAVLREIPGITFTPLPKRILHYKKRRNDQQ